MRALREHASAIFFSDFERHPERYVAGELPRLPFADGKFDLTLVSYLLFAYQDRFDYEFHSNSILEVMRVTRGEARIYPTVTLKHSRVNTFQCCNPMRPCRLLNSWKSKRISNFWSTPI